VSKGFIQLPMLMIDLFCPKGRVVLFYKLLYNPLVKSTKKGGVECNGTVGGR
jgi:hypothetical protein